MHKTTLCRSVLAALYGGLGISTLTWAQATETNPLSNSASQSQALVTGSHIPRRLSETPEHSNPFLLVLQREDIEATGLSNLDELLGRLPQFGSAQGRLFNAMGDGSTSASLRHLGSDRTLVLINGRRTVAGLTGSTDLSLIPISIVERIEVLTEGAGAIYGSDAIAGVVNIITRSEFRGMQANAKIGEFDQGDGQEQAYDFSVGTGDERAQMFFNVSYLKQEPVSAGDRLISAEPQFGTGNRQGSSATPFGRFFDLNNPFGMDLTCPLPANQCQNAANFRPWNGSTDLFFSLHRSITCSPPRSAPRSLPRGAMT